MSEAGERGRAPSKASGGRRAPGAVRRRNEACILAAAEAVFAEHGYGGASLAMIAGRAGLPRSNLLYYFKSKQGLYLALLERTMRRWNAQIDEIGVACDPARVLTDFIHAKMEMARDMPRASRLFAGEILQGAPRLGPWLRGPLRQWVMARASIFETWRVEGRIDARVEPVALIFLIWSATQHYADFEAQVLAITGRERLDEAEHRRVTDFICHMILSGCGLEAPA